MHFLDLAISCIFRFGHSISCIFRFDHSSSCIFRFDHSISCIFRSSLFDPNLLQAGPSLYYNTSPGSGEISVDGSPWGFFTFPLSGNSGNGFPVVLTTLLPEARVPIMLRALSEGAYLSKHLTRTMTAKVSIIKHIDTSCIYR